MISGTVVRNDEVWQGHPDVAFFKNKFYVVHRQSSHHRANKDTQIVLVSSDDGTSYSPPIVIADSSSKRFNCPRLSVVDDKLWICCDVITGDPEEDFISVERKVENTSIWMWHSEDGENWQGHMLSKRTMNLRKLYCAIY